MSVTNGDICELCHKNECLPFTKEVKLVSFCKECFKGTMYQKHAWILEFITINAPKFLEYIYWTKYTKARECEQYFKQFGGDNWRDKYHSCTAYKLYQKGISSDKFKDTLKKLIIMAYADLELIITNDEINGAYKVEQYCDIYYTFEQFERILSIIDANTNA